MSSPLNEAIHVTATAQARNEVVAHLWRGVTKTSQHELDLDWDPYFTYYTTQCRMAMFDQGKYLSARTHSDMLRIIHLLEDEPTEQAVKTKIRETLTQHRSLEDENEMLDGTIKLASRLFAMINIGSLPSEVPGRPCLSWLHGSFREAVHHHFSGPSQTEKEDIIIGSDFTARNIHRLSDIEIVMTDNLVDHLRLVEGDTKVCIFYHITFLKWMKATRSPIFPEGFIEETLDTLTLLFPGKDRRTKQWLENDSRTTCLDRGLFRAGHFHAGHVSRRLLRYRYWHDRLIILKETVDEATPPSKALLQALRDNKRGDQWFNSWVAIVAIGLTLFFGLVQSIEGAIQVFRAYHPVPGT